MGKRKDRQDEIREWNEELSWDTTRKYVEMLKEEDRLLSIENVDVDVSAVISRHFKCDGHRCVHWQGEDAVLDRSCCSRYDVPVTKRDRNIIMKRLPEVLKNLSPDHRLHDEENSPFQINDDYGYELLHEDATDACQFSIYDGQVRYCAIHKTALEKGENPQDWKPIACSMWPLAVEEYEDEDGDDRFLLTIYHEETDNLFDGEDEPFACIVDNHKSYPRVYESERSTLEYVFGKAWWKKLEQKALKQIKLESQEA